MSYTDPKIYFSDPTAFQKGFQGSFNEYIKLQREQLEKQKKSDETQKQDSEKIASGLYNSDVYKEASKAVRDVLTSYFKDVQVQYMQTTSKSEKEKIMADALAEANEYVNSYRITNESKGNLIATDYAGKPIEDFMYSEGPGIPSYINGKLGMQFGEEKTFLSKQDMIQSKPIYASEVENTVSEKVKESLDFFNKNNVPDNIKIVEQSRNITIKDLVSSFSQREKIAYYTRNDIVLQENQTLEQAIAEDLKQTFNNTKVYNEALANSGGLTKQELDIQKEQRAEERVIRSEQRKAKAKTEEQAKIETGIRTKAQDYAREIINSPGTAFRNAGFSETIDGQSLYDPINETISIKEIGSNGKEQIVKYNTKDRDDLVVLAEKLWEIRYSDYFTSKETPQAKEAFEQFIISSIGGN